MRSAAAEHIALLLPVGELCPSDFTKQPFIGAPAHHDRIDGLQKRRISIVALARDGREPSQVVILRGDIAVQAGRDIDHDFTLHTIPSCCRNLLPQHSLFTPPRRR
ncbi:hypothetical protein SDC9_200917 [bioreactor metagenome]|uniref:Uncharacterized protein n=1 Tax=bioreactor metagenome TaxID=1076179 RepID=A0A645J1C8_9ZZZZ